MYLLYCIQPRSLAVLITRVVLVSHHALKVLPSRPASIFRCLYQMLKENQTHVVAGFILLCFPSLPSCRTREPLLARFTCVAVTCAFLPEPQRSLGVLRQNFAAPGVSSFPGQSMIRNPSHLLPNQFSARERQAQQPINVCGSRLPGALICLCFNRGCCWLGRSG